MESSPGGVDIPQDSTVMSATQLKYWKALTPPRLSTTALLASTGELYLETKQGQASLSKNGPFRLGPSTFVDRTSC